MSARVTIAFALLLAACASASGVGRPRTEVAAEHGYREVLARTDLHGAPVARVEQPTVVVFFASWCSACRRELGVLGDLRTEIPELRVIGVNAFESWGELSDAARMQRFVAEHAPWMQVVRGDGALREAFGGVTKIPTLFVYDRAGAVVAEFRQDQRAAPGPGELRAAIVRAR